MMLHAIPLHPFKLTVLCGVHANGIIDPYFFLNKQEVAITLNGVRCRHMLNTFFFFKNAGVKHRHLLVPTGWCYVSHIATETINLLREHFGDNVISRNSSVNWLS